MPPPGPYTFGSENFSGRVEAFPALKQIFAYDQGNVYHVDGFDDQMKVAGETRLWGQVRLDKAYESEESASPQVATTIQIAPLTGDATSAGSWQNIPTETLHLGSADLATAQLAYDAGHLYARFHVVDDTPLQNSADDLPVIFKGGDAVGLDLGPAGDRKSAKAGDLRILAAMIHGQPRIVGMKIHSDRDKHPQMYQTGGGGTRNFDFVGEIPGGTAVLKADADGKGYNALLTIPRDFLELPLTAGTSMKGDLEVLLSGNGARGLQAVSRNWLNSGGHVETTMVDDVPTESWLYPQFWGEVSVK
jgi:hypothetical protein